MSTKNGGIAPQRSERSEVDIQEIGGNQELRRPRRSIAFSRNVDGVRAVTAGDSRGRYLSRLANSFSNRTADPRL